MKKVWLFNTYLGWGYYFYFDNKYLYLLSTSSIYDLFMIPLNSNFDSDEKLSKFKIEIGNNFDKIKELIKNSEEVDCRKYLYDNFTGYSNILDIPQSYFYYRSHYTLLRYEYLKLFASLYNRDNREEKINHILNN